MTSSGGAEEILRPKDLIGRARHRFTHLTLPRFVWTRNSNHDISLLFLPSFTAGFQTSLVQAFTKLGVTEAFDTRRVNFIIITPITIVIVIIIVIRRANFSEITDKEGLAVTNIFHKALIEVASEQRHNFSQFILDKQGTLYVIQSVPKKVTKREKEI